jgi:biotin carboxylase
MSNYIIVGKSFNTLRDKILMRGDTYTLLQDVLATKYPEKRLKNRLLANFSSRDSILEAVHRLPGTYDGVIAIYENYILPAAWIAEALDLPGLPIASAEACTDKFIMRSLFLQAPEKISPDFAIVNNLEDLKSFANDHDFPLILKPANLAKSLLVTKNNNELELSTSYEKMLANIDAVYKKYAPNSKPKVIIEEFMSGPIFSVDAFVDSLGEPHVLEQIVDYKTGYDIGYDDNFHYSRVLPTKLSPVDQDKLREVARLGTKALGMKNSPAHIEIIMTEAGPFIVEIGARNGGYRERMHALANDLDIYSIALDTALGIQPNITTTKNENCAVLELFPKNSGTFIELQNEAKLRHLPSFTYLSLKAKPGQYVGKSSEGYKMCAVIILHHQDSSQFKNDLDFVNNHVSVRTTQDQ